MATEVKLPRLGQGMESGTVVRWLKAEGERVERGEPLYEVDTDKVTQEVESDAEGVLLKIVLAAGEAPVGKTLAWIAHVLPEAMLYGLWALLFIVAGRVFLRYTAVYVPLFVLAVGLASAPSTGNTIGDVACGLVFSTMLLLAIRAGGLLAACASWMAYHLPEAVPLTFDTSVWFADRSIVVLMLYLALATWACVIALAPGRRFANVPAIA